MLLHTAQEKHATFNKRTSALFSNLPYSTDYIITDASKLWTLKVYIFKMTYSMQYIFKMTYSMQRKIIFKMTYSMQCKIRCTVKSFLNTIVALLVTGTILRNKVIIFRSNTSYLQHEKMHILYNKMAPNQRGGIFTFNKFELLITENYIYSFT